MQKSTRKAFTLVELLVVVAVIGILFVVLLSKVDFATDKAKATGVQTDFRSFQLAIETVAKENAGLTTFGWDTGDVGVDVGGGTYVGRGDGIRNSYDEKDDDKNGTQNGSEEAFTGRMEYAETWTGVYTMKNPADTSKYDDKALAALEAAINKNLDPKLHITIGDDGTITMANQARDPWKNEYEGYFLQTASADNRGAIVIYSKGANGNLGSVSQLANGEVTTTVKTVPAATRPEGGYAEAAGATDNNVAGKDDYSIAVVYTYKNGYGEIITTTTGFSNNQ